VLNARREPAQAETSTAPVPDKENGITLGFVSISRPLSERDEARNREWAGEKTAPSGEAPPAAKVSA
jgi:hypothetical protein